jgi:hypothetical protein
MHGNHHITTVHLAQIKKVHTPRKPMQKQNTKVKKPKQTSTHTRRSRLLPLVDSRQHDERYSSVPAMYTYMCVYRNHQKPTQPIAYTDVALSTIDVCELCVWVWVCVILITHQANQGTQKKGKQTAAKKEWHATRQCAVCFEEECGGTKGKQQAVGKKTCAYTKCTRTKKKEDEKCTYGKSI